MGSEKPLSDINFFICSTYVDLKQHREAVINNIRSHAGVINAQEFFGARDQKPLATCLEEVDKADVFLLFLGHRYGTPDPESKKSFVECEYDRAITRGLPRFAYVMSDEHPFPFTYTSRGEEAEKLEAFKALVTKDLTVDFFTTPDDLATKVYGDLVRRLPEKGFKLGHENGKSGLPTAGEVLTDFGLLPMLNHGRQLELRIRFGTPSRASEDECEAFGYTYGSALRRSFETVDKSLRDIAGSLVIFAENDAALRLMQPPKGVEVNVVVKTIRGHYTRSEPIYGLLQEPHPYLANDVSSIPIEGKRRVVVDHRITRYLLRGLEFVERVGTAS